MSNDPTAAGMAAKLTAHYDATGEDIFLEARAKIAALTELLAIRARDHEAEIERLTKELESKTGVILTVGSGLNVYGSIEAIMRVQTFMLLDSAHPIEREDVRRSLAKDLQAAEARAEASEAEAKRLREAAWLSDRDKDSVRKIIEANIRWQESFLTAPHTLNDDMKRGALGTLRELLANIEPALVHRRDALSPEAKPSAMEGQR